MTGVLIRGRQDTRKTPCEDRSRDWNDALVSQGTPRTPGNHQKVGDSSELILPQNLQEETTMAIP